MDIFVHDRATGQTTRASIDSSGNEGERSLGSSNPSISADGRFVVFESTAVLVPDDTNTSTDVYLHDLETHLTERVSIDSQGQQGYTYNISHSNGVSGDGRFVVFESKDFDLPGSSNSATDVFVRDRLLGVTECLSVDSLGHPANGASTWPSITPDGRYVVFDSFATNLVGNDINDSEDVFVHDRQTGRIIRASVGSGGQGDSYSRGPSITSDGRRVAFESVATNLIVGDTNGFKDVFVRDLLIKSTVRVSIATSGTEGNGNSGSFLDGSCIAGSGRHITFVTSASNLVPNDTNAVDDVLVRGPEFTLESSHREVIAGDMLRFEMYDGLPGNGAALWVTAVDGVPFLAPIFIGSFANDGFFTLGGTIPRGLGTFESTFRGYGVGESTFVEATNDVLVLFR